MRGKLFITEDERNSFWFLIVLLSNNSLVHNFQTDIYNTKEIYVGSSFQTLWQNYFKINFNKYPFYNA